jgi:hypothetical protein
MHSGGKKECKKTEFGDNRLEKRMEKIIETLLEKPNVCIPQAFEDVYQAKACYRFWSNHNVDPDKILLHHKELTIEAAKQQETVLIIQDTTEGNFSTHKKLEDIGYLEGKKQRGLKVHSAMAVSGEGLPLGIIWQRQWIRTGAEYGKKHQRKKKATSDKESQRWIDCHNAINKQLLSNKRIIHIADRESDIYDFLVSERKENQYILIRFAQDRRIEDELRRIKAALNSQECSGTFEVKVGRRGNEYQHTTKLNTKYKRVKVLAPSNRKKGEGQSSIELTAIKAYEEVDPTSPNTELIEWYLLTTLPVNSITEVEECVHLYSLRWLIERYHYTLKSGCQIEKLQLEKGSRIENAIATYSQIAWRILYMTYLSRIEPDLDARAILTEEELETLKLKFNKTGKKIIEEDNTIKIVIICIARIGGFLGRKSDGMPGVKTLWRGLMALRYLVEGIRLARSNSVNLLDNNLNSSSYS